MPTFVIKIRIAEIDITMVHLQTNTGTGTEYISQVIFTPQCFGDSAYDLNFRMINFAS